MRGIFYRETRAILFCFSLDDRSTFVELCQNWMKDAQENNDLFDEYTVIYLAGLKSDLKNNENDLSIEAEVRRGWATF